VFAVWFGGREGVADAYALDPERVFVVARLTAAAVGTLAVGLVYLAGARLFDRRAGLLAAALLAVAYLPLFYGKLALNDVPTLAPIALSLWGTAGILRRGWTLDFLLAGIGLGLACATKYTGGIVLLPLLTAAALGPLRGRAALTRTALALAVSAAAFVAANPYAILDFEAFRDGLQHQSDAAGDALGKLGLDHENGWAYYAWTATWGLGWAPVALALVGLGLLGRRDPRALAVLAPAPLLFVAFMGSQERYFGRWLLPVFPIACLLAAYAVVRLVELAGARRPGLVPVLAATGAVVLCGQGVIYAVHSGLVLSRDDTRNLARAWLVDNVPEHGRIVVEPVVPDAWATDVGRPSPRTANGARWVKFPTSRSNIANDGTRIPGKGRIVNIEDYERTLYPGLIDRYEAGGYCHVISGSTQRGRAEAEPGEVPRAVAYYRELERRADLVHEATPYRAGAGPVPFSFDFSFNFYPLAYDRPGPVMQVWRLRGGRCAGLSSQ
jgi:4-amino-4-deoxy-L-arabinose transferase-like glycosyltransferase